MYAPKNGSALSTVALQVKELHKAFGELRRPLFARLPEGSYWIGRVNGVVCYGTSFGKMPENMVFSVLDRNMSRYYDILPGISEIDPNRFHRC